ncbi:redox-regulated ATPase YchF [archaeon]|nr:redox-regulated ATPase YchF [archaeon]
MLIGIVGKPNSGKSTFFKAATLIDVGIANYPFTTIKPNHGVGFVRIDCADKDFNVKCNPKFGYCTESIRFVPVELLDVAGLVPGAHKGYGLGNQFLDDLRQAHALIHVIDVSGSTNEKGEIVEQGTHNPASDILFLEEELDMWYLGLIKKGWDKFSRTVMQEKKSGSELAKAIAKQLSGLMVTEEIVNPLLKQFPEDIDLWGEKELKCLAAELRKKTKPTIIAANKIDISGADKEYEKIKKQFPYKIIIPCSGECELALRNAAKSEAIEYLPGSQDFKILKQINEKQKTALEFIKRNVLEKYGGTGIQECLNKAVFELLGYIAVFPVPNAKLRDKDGKILPDCMLIENGTTAQEFAFRIHEDIGRNFIKAQDIRTKQVIGKEHKLKHRDVVEIVSGR